MNGLKILTISLGVLSFLGLSAQTDSTLEFSLQEAQNFAIENFYATKNAELDIESAKKRVWETTAQGLPQVSASGRYEHIPGDIPELEFGMDSLFGYLFNSLSELGYPPPEDLMGDGSDESNAIAPRNNITYSVTVSQLLFSGEYFIGLQAAKVYKTLSEESFEQARIDMKENLAGTYYAILVLEANESVLEKSLENLRLNLEHTRKSFEVGLIDDTEVAQLELTVKRTENDLSTLKNQIRTMYRMFNYQMGLKANAKVTLTDSLQQLITANIVDDAAYDFELEENITYQQLYTQEELQKLSMNRYKATYLPTLSAFYQYNDQLNEPAINFTINHIVGVNANWTIFSSGMRNAQVSQARIEYEKAQNMRLQESERLILESQQAKYDYRTALEQYENEKSNFELSEKVLNDARSRYEQGVISALELSITNNQFLQSQLSYSMAIQQLLNAKIALDKAFNNL